MTDEREPDEAPDWESLRDALEGPDPGASVEAVVQQIPLGDIPRVFSWLDADPRTKLLEELDAHSAATLLEQLPDAQSADELAELEPKVAAAIVGELASNDQADILAELEDDEADAILEVMPPDEAADAERLASYPERSAGGIMITEFLSYDVGVSVADVLDDLRSNAEEYLRHDVQYVYLTAAGVLVGVLRLRDLVLTAAATPVRDIMLTATDSVAVDAPLEILDDSSRHARTSARPWSTQPGICWASCGTPTSPRPSENARPAITSRHRESSAARSFAPCPCSRARGAGCRGSASTWC